MANLKESVFRQNAYAYNGVMHLCRTAKYKIFKVQYNFLNGFAGTWGGSAVAVFACYTAPADGRKQQKNFSVLHKYQHAFPGVTSLIFGLRGFSPSIR